MKTVITFYKSGREFLAENGGILAKYPLETVFFEVNAVCIAEANENNFIIKLQRSGKFLIAIHNADYPMNIFGDKSLCAEFAVYAAQSKLTFSKIIGALDTCEAFLEEYEKLVICTHEIHLSMDIMQCRNPVLCDISQVEQASETDVDELANLAASFYAEAVGESESIAEYKCKIAQNVGDFALIRKNGEIVSFAGKKREVKYLAAITYVYTVPQYRCQGLSRKVVTYLTKQIVDSGKLAYLFVDKNNPISNHLYTSIGYSYAVPQYEIALKRE